MPTNFADRQSFTDQEALDFHAGAKPGKLEIRASKPMATQKDLSLAYSPGVAVPVLAIAANPDRAYDYTTKANRVLVISNGTAILGLGDLGALASKPVMEGKAVLFKRFADIDAMDLEIDTTDVEAFIGAVRYLGPTCGAINLEDIKAPDCFLIEQRLRELMDIPVFHDDQHGRAIITAAGLINALQLTGRDIGTTKLVVYRAGSAGIAGLDLLMAMGLARSNIILCDAKGVVYQGRSENMSQWESPYAAETHARTLAEALKGADVFIGRSVKGAVTQAMVKTMARKPIIFAMANPDPEITPEEVRAVRSDAIIATGRWDYPNQINNVLCFPYIFRGALDVAAKAINTEMKIAAAHALAELAREEVPEEVAAAYRGARYVYGRDYIIPVPFDPRLIVRVASAVAEAAMKSGVARRPIADTEATAGRLASRTRSSFSSLSVRHLAAIAYEQREGPKGDPAPCQVKRGQRFQRCYTRGTGTRRGRPHHLSQARPPRRPLRPPSGAGSAITACTFGDIRPERGFWDRRPCAMSPVGHSRRFDDVHVMSAFPPIATM